MAQDRRGFRRYPASPDLNAAVVSIGGREFHATVIDVSAEGFRVCIDNAPKLEMGVTLNLETAQGHFVATVVNAHVQADNSVVVGLKRTGDKPLASSQRFETISLARRGPRKAPRRSVQLLWIIVFAIAVGAVLGALGTDRIQQLVRDWVHSR